MSPTMKRSSSLGPMTRLSSPEPWAARSVVSSVMGPPSIHGAPVRAMNQPWSGSLPDATVSPRTRRWVSGGGVGRPSGVDAFPVQLVGGGDDELPPRVDVLPHEQLEDLLGGLHVGRGHPPQHAVRGVHRGLRELVGVHLAETLVALDRLLDLLPLGG